MYIRKFTLSKEDMRMGGYFTRTGNFTWRVSDCEELSGVTHRRSKWCDTNHLPVQKSVREVNDERWPLVSSRVFATAKIRTVSTA